MKRLALSDLVLVCAFAALVLGVIGAVAWFGAVWWGWFG